MNSKTFVVENINNELIADVEQTINFINGEIISVNDNTVNWQFIYGKQTLACKTIIKGEEVETTATNTANILVGEGVVVNKFFNLLGERIEIFPKEIRKQAIQNKNKTTAFGSKKSFDLKFFLKIAAILTFCIYAYYISSSKKQISSISSDSESTSINNYVTNSGFKATFNESSLEKLVKYSVHNDINGIETLVTTGEVFDLPSGQEAYVLESKFGRVKIRLLQTEEEVWTFTEAIYK